MTSTEPRTELIVLAADLSIQRTIEAILKRYPSLEIREISFKVVRQPNYDSGVLQSGYRVLQAQSNLYQHALAICDRHGCGREAKSREELETLIENQLSNRWGDRAAAIVIDPELENWVWTDSPHVARAIGWPGDMAALRMWLQSRGLLTEGHAKPADPQAALEKALARTRKPKSSSLFGEIASKVSLQACTDPAFQKLKTTLQRWFPPAPSR